MRYFVPSDEIPPLRILANALASVPPSVARAAIEAHTQPGDVILDPFCAGVGVIQTALDLNRKIIAASFNPIAILAIEATLWPIDPRAALTHLADARKGPDRLRDHILELYRTRCPICDKEATALEFIWDREARAPIGKRVRCKTCGDNTAPIDADDQTRAARFEPRGLSFWLLLGRVIDRAHEDADRVSEVLDAYTPRAQMAIGDILLKLEGLSPADQTALRPALVSLLDACSSLHSAEEFLRRISGLKPPPQYVEKNIWIEFENICHSLSPASTPAVLQRADSIDSLLAASTASTFLLAGPTREAAKLIPQKSIQLMLAYPPLPRPGFWSLSTVWTAWLWGKSHITAMLPLLSRHRTSWDWQWRAISSALHALEPALNSSALNIFSFANDEAVMESVALASAGANQTLEHVTCDSHDGTRVTWQTHAELAGDRDLESLALDIRRSVRETATRILRDRAEPTDRLVLQAAIYGALGQSDVLAIIAHLPEGDQSPLAFMRDVVQSTLAAADLPVIALDEHLRWLKEDGRSGTSATFRWAFNAETKPLADRVEAAIVDLLRTRNEWPGDELLREVYRRFPDWLTPDRALVATCIGSYVEEIEAGRVRLRSEDVFEAREAEVRAARDNLETIGTQLGYEVKSKPEVVWLNGKEVVYTFVIAAQAEIDPLLRAAEGVLVIPGGRATLLQHKMKRDPRLSELHWQILKFSSLRHLTEDGSYSLNTLALAFGLEPPIEQAGTQIKLL